MNTVPCPICEFTVGKWQERYDDRDGNYYDCPNCGRYLISRSALSSMETMDEKTRAVLSHGIWEGQIPETPFSVSSTMLEAAQKKSLPDPAEQIDRLLLFLGRNQESPGSSIRYPYGCFRAKCGCMTKSDETFIIASAKEEGLIIDQGTHMFRDIGLTLKGWQRFHEVQRGAVHSKTAFMAMPFGNESVTQMVNDVFRNAVKETGFTLKPVSDAPRAGLIDDHIRVDIRLCRFLIADLTCENRGAYWEAGYAEGLGKPVIYTCNKQYFESQGTHFDTNHHQTVVWDPAEPARAAEDLKATIRATLPFEAIMPKES